MSNHWSTIKLRDDVVSANGAERPTVTTLDRIFRSIESGIEFGSRIQSTLARPTYNFKVDENVPQGASFRGSSPGVPETFAGFSGGAATLLILGAVVFFGLMLVRRR